MSDERFDAFKRVTLMGQPLPDDLQKLWLMQASDTNRLAKLGFRLIEPGMDIGMLSHFPDRAGPDILANMAAIEDVLALSTMVVEREDGELLGYWHGPEGTPIDKAPILQLDTEGQFEIEWGRTLSEAIVALHVVLDGEFAERREWYAQNGIVIAARSLSELKNVAKTSHPRDVHLEAYNRHRVAAGLPPFED